MTDPKPNLSRAAILANIEYAKGLQQEHSLKYRQAPELETKYLLMLKSLKEA